MSGSADEHGVPAPEFSDVVEGLAAEDDGAPCVEEPVDVLDCLLDGSDDFDVAADDVDLEREDAVDEQHEEPVLDVRDGDDTEEEEEDCDDDDDCDDGDDDDDDDSDDERPEGDADLEDTDDETVRSPFEFVRPLLLVGVVLLLAGVVLLAGLVGADALWSPKVAVAGVFVRGKTSGGLSAMRYVRISIHAL